MKLIVVAMLAMLNPIGVVASAIVHRLSALDLSYPSLSNDELIELKAARQALIETTSAES